MASTLMGCFIVSEVIAASGPRAIEVTEIFENIVRIHPEGQRIAADGELVDYVEKLEKSADDLDLADYIIRLHKLFSHINDGHTAVLSLGLQAEPFTLRTPILIESFADGLYVTEAKDEALPLLGGRVERVNGFPVAEILRAYVDGAQGDNRAFAMRWSSFLFAFPGWLHGLGFADGPYDSPIAVDVVMQSGETRSSELLPRKDGNIGRLPFKKRASPVDEMSGSSNSPNFVRTLPNRKAVYLALDQMDDTATKSFAEFTSEARTALADTDAERVVLDLRRNGGGNNMLPEPLRRSLVKSRFNRPGGIFVLIGPRTFSAAMNFVTRLERETDALFVGEPTGGRPNHFGDAKLLRASATGVEYLVSTLRWQDSAPFDSRTWLLPDIPAPPTFQDYVLGKDSALEAALSYDATLHIPNDTFAGTPWLRPSQQAEWRFFFEPGSGGISGTVD